MVYKAKFDRSRRFGLEIEFFGVNQFELQHSLNEWGVKSKIGLFELPSNEFWYLSSDRSIEGEDSIELRSPILCGMEGLAEVRKVMTLLNYLDPKINSSCGLHVHWSSTDYTGKNIMALLRLYAKFEAVIDGLVSLDRRENKNKHCMSLVQGNSLSWVSELDRKETSIALQIALKFDANYKVRSVGNFNALGSRKHKVNITSYLKFGTIEFRHHESTLDIDEVTNWIVFTQQFINRAKLTSVSREMSAKPTLGEMLRILGMVEFQGSGDALVEQTRSWLKEKYGSVRKKKPIVAERIFQNVAG